MAEKKLILLTRVGCCLCEGLEERLKKLSLDKLAIPLKLYVRDIDGTDVTSSDNALYSMQVPVLLLELDPLLKRFELPRVSPRLTEEGLSNWLDNILQEIIRRS